MKMIIVFSCKVRPFALNEFTKTFRLFANNETTVHIAANHLTSSHFCTNKLPRLIIYQLLSFLDNLG